MNRPPTSESSRELSRAWQLTTAVRVFALALAVGLVLTSAPSGASLVALVGVGLLAATASGLELAVRARRLSVVPIGEAVLVVALMASPELPVEPLVYLTAPVIVAGARYGGVSTLNTGLTAVLAAAAMAAVTSPGAVWLGTALFWLCVGLGVGLLVARLGRSVRALEEQQAPYVAAHRLVTELHDLADRHDLALDSRAGATALLLQLRGIADAGRGALALDRSGIRIGAHEGLGGLLDLASRRSQPVRLGTGAAWPLRVGSHRFGAVALDRPGRLWTEEECAALQRLVDEGAVRLETAVAFERVRDLATTEERVRVARELHDGAAQQIAGLGYRLDGLVALSDDPVTVAAARELRGEVTRVVGELRAAIHGLRRPPTDVAAALASRAREVGSEAGLRVHLALAEGRPCPEEIGEALLRIGIEAVANVAQHAHAENLWLRLSTEPGAYALVVEDDGTGLVRPRRGHFGLATMRERAERAGLAFAVDHRSGGGTRISVHTPTAQAPLRAPAPQEMRDVHHRLAGR